MNDTGMNGDDQRHKCLVHTKDGRAVTTSDAVALTFGVSESVIVEAIERVIAQHRQLSQFHITAIGRAGANGSDRPTFELDRDGFALIAIALANMQQVDLKLLYLEKFEALESEFDYPVDVVDLEGERTLRDWPFEELRAKKGVADLYRITFGTSAAQWAMQELGFPTPPQKFVRLERQMEFPIDSLPAHASAA
jgi:hypothetical protein